MNILVVEDDHLLNSALCYNLSAAGHQALSAFSLAQARELAAQPWALVVLDVNLPDGSGFALCRELKALRPDCGVIFLTANDLEQDMLRGFELGADDYVTKPFSMNVFLKKIAALLARLQPAGAGRVYEDGRLCIRFEQLQATLDGQPLALTPMEYRLLEVLTAHPQTVLTRRMLLEKLWDPAEKYVDEHALTAAVSRLRAKLEKPGMSPYFRTVYGMGYLWLGDGR